MTAVIVYCVVPGDITRDRVVVNMRDQYGMPQMPRIEGGIETNKHIAYFGRVQLPGMPPLLVYNEDEMRRVIDMQIVKWQFAVATIIQLGSSTTSTISSTKYIIHSHTACETETRIGQKYTNIHGL